MPARLRARLALGLGATLLALLLAEELLGGPLRPELASTRDAAWQARQRQLDRTLYEADAELVYMPRPGASLDMDYGPAAFSAQGLREERTVSPEPTAGVSRVALLGDSLVWGELLAREQALPAVLDRRLGPAVEVLNFGVSGYDTVQEAAWYRRQVRSFAPDHLVLVFCLNDLLTMSGPFHLHATEAQRAAYAAERAWLDAAAPVRNETVSALWLAERSGEGSQVLAALRHVRRWHGLFTLPGGYVDEILLSFSDHERVARMEAALALLGRELEADGVSATLVVSPALYWWHRYPWTGVHDTVRAAGEAAGFEVVDPVAGWLGQDPEPLRFPGDNLHYTPAGIERLADVLTPVLQRRLRERTPSPP